jgi:hypothetical protein
VGQDEKAPLRFSAGKAQGPARLVRPHRDFQVCAWYLLDPGLLSELDASTATILLDEVESGLPKSSLDFRSCLRDRPGGHHGHQAA